MATARARQTRPPGSSPTIDKGHVFIGGGAAGVLCVDAERLTLEGKELTPSAVRKILKERGQQLLAAYRKRSQNE